MTLYLFSIINNTIEPGTEVLRILVRSHFLTFDCALSHGTSCLLILYSITWQLEFWNLTC